jgi:hypothetical protein
MIKNKKKFTFYLSLCEEIRKKFTYFLNYIKRSNMHPIHYVKRYNNIHILSKSVLKNKNIIHLSFKLYLTLKCASNSLR